MHRDSDCMYVAHGFRMIISCLAGVTASQIRIFHASAAGASEWSPFQRPRRGFQVAAGMSLVRRPSGRAYVLHPARRAAAETETENICRAGGCFDRASIPGRTGRTPSFQHLQAGSSRVTTSSAHRHIDAHWHSPRVETRTLIEPPRCLPSYVLVVSGASLHRQVSRARID